MTNEEMAREIARGHVSHPVLRRQLASEIEAALNAKDEAAAQAKARIKLLEEQNASQRARMRHAQAKLDGGNDCFDSLEEVVEATVRGRGDVYGARIDASCEQ